MRTARTSNPSSWQTGSLGTRCVLAGGILCLLAGAGLWVAQPVTAESARGPASVEDVQLTIEARQALSHDPQLRGLNLWVYVHERVATLSGPVPAPELVRLAEQRLQAVPGVLRVVNQLGVERSEDQAVKNFRPLTRPQAAQANAERPGSGVLTAHSSARPREQTQPQEGTFTLPPIHLSVPEQGPSQTSVAKPSLDTVVEGAEDPARALERLREVDERFQNVYGDVVDGAVFLRGSVRRGEDQFALATLISKLPGVTRVVLQDVRVQGNR